ERGQMAYVTGKRICELVMEDVRPSQIMTREAFENAIAVASALGASSNCPPHLIAIARHMGVELSLEDWQRIGADVPLLVNCMPAGKYLGEGFHHAGGVPAVMHELQKAGRLHEDCATVSGRSISDIVRTAVTSNTEVILPYDKPLKYGAGFIVLSGNFFDSAIMKMSVVGEAFRKTYLSEPGAENSFEARAIVFEGPEDYRARIDDPTLDIDERCILVIRGAGPVGYPGSAEVVNMDPPAALIKRGIDSLPCLGDGRQSGTSASPSILNMSPEAAIGGGLALLRTNDRLRVDLNARSVNLLVDDEELAVRRQAWTPSMAPSQTPWQELYRQLVGQLSTGGCLEPATLHMRIIARNGPPRHSH
ncbi:dihydroxy-acid dehydratase, partial [Pseudomonas coronafaciens]